MKIQVVKPGEKEIDGYLPLTLIEQDIQNVINNSCTEILALQSLDYIPFDKATLFLQALLTKVRLNGTITLTGIHAVAFAQNIINEMIDSKTASNIIDELRSIVDTRIVIQILESNNFMLDYITITGNFYELRATRRES